MNDAHKLTDEAARKLRAIKALAEHGAPGERENAQNMLEIIAAKYGIPVWEITEEKKKTYYFKYSERIERRLLNQIIYMVTGDTGRGVRIKRTLKELAATCTEAERIEIVSNYEFFKRALHEELDTFMTAFASVNNLFPPPDKDQLRKDGDESSIGLEKARRALSMMQGMETHTMKKALPSAKE